MRQIASTSLSDLSGEQAEKVIERSRNDLAYDWI